MDRTDSALKKGNYHFIGLGGIGMSALARLLLQRGEGVQGSDVAKSPLLEELKKEGAILFVGHSKEAIEGASAVIYTSAVKGDNEELIEAKKRGLPLLHRSELLERCTEGKKGLFVTGTHGKTTTSALLATLLVEAKLDPSFIVGGIVKALGTNGRAGKGDYFVAEGDESDGSFLKGTPFGAIVTNLGYDHLDYWKEGGLLEEGFATFFSKVLSTDHLFWCGDDPVLKRIAPFGVSYGFSEGVDLQISSYRVGGMGISFDLSFQGKIYREVFLSLWGRHNALNGAAVFGLGLQLGISEEVIRKTFAHFGGTRRRLEWKGEVQRVSLFDDYGHHPTEIRATLKALRERIGEKRLVAIFQPHRYTRVRDCQEEFCTAFEEADEVVLTEIYSAGEEPIEGVTSAVLYTKMRKVLGSRLHFFPRSLLEAGVAQLLSPFDVAITLGAGDITKAGEPILEEFRNRGAKLKVALLCGGESPEHPVSLRSTRAIHAALDPTLFDSELFKLTKEGGWMVGEGALEESPSSAEVSPLEAIEKLLSFDVAIPVFHGPLGEDGMIQGFLKTLKIPYVGCDFGASALCMEKSWTKQTALFHKVPTPPWIERDIVSYRKDPLKAIEEIEEELSYPVWVKPVHLGSSLGVGRAENREELLACFERAFQFDERAIVEREVVGRQIEFGLIGNHLVEVAEACEILNHGAFYDYERKYGSQAIGVEVPAKITPLQRKIGEELARTMYRGAGCQGLARIDFFLDEKGHFWLNEINPFPGFTETSGYPIMWQKSGLPIPRLVEKMVWLALERSRREARRGF